MEPREEQPPVTPKQLDRFPQASNTPSTNVPTIGHTCFQQTPLSNIWLAPELMMSEVSTGVVGVDLPTFPDHHHYDYVELSNGVSQFYSPAGFEHLNNGPQQMLAPNTNGPGSASIYNIQDNSRLEVAPFTHLSATAHTTHALSSTTPPAQHQLQQTLDPKNRLLQPTNHNGEDSILGKYQSLVLPQNLNNPMPQSLNRTSLQVVSQSANEPSSLHAQLQSSMQHLTQTMSQSLYDPVLQKMPQNLNGASLHVVSQSSNEPSLHAQPQKPNKRLLRATPAHLNKRLLQAPPPFQAYPQIRVASADPWSHISVPWSQAPLEPSPWPSQTPNNLIGAYEPIDNNLAAGSPSESTENIPGGTRTSLRACIRCRIYNRGPYNLLDKKFELLRHIKWNSSPLKTIELTQTGAPLRISIRSFSHTDLNYENIRPTAHHMFSHPYGLADPEAAVLAIKDYIFYRGLDYFKSKIDRQDRLAWNIFGMAYSLTCGGANPLLKDVMHLWVAVRFLEGGWRIIGDELLDLGATGAREIPLRYAPIIDYQLSAIIVQQILLPLRDKVVDNLQKLMKRHRPQEWIVILLSSFILLHSCELLIEQQRSFARRKEAPVRYSNMDLVHNIHTTSNTILGYFHASNRGKIFHMDLNQPGILADFASAATLAASQLAPMREIISLVQQRNSHFLRLAASDRYEERYWFTGQLFLSNWSPPNIPARSPPADIPQAAYPKRQFETLN
ncbi:hypothetical protein FQN57_002574 [Myotisia sp. PD_48]|nr:hypothetical protein FQN57_002574 [Myotisia sp. PD_48]